MVNCPLILMSCSTMKIPGPGKLKAIDRYDGPAFRMLRKHRAEKHPMPWIIILSAKYGALLYDDLIEDYDQRLTYERAQDLKYDGHKTHGLLVRNRLKGCTSHVCIAGEDYAEVYRHWAEAGVGNDLNVADGGIGMKLHALRLVLDSLQRKELLSPQLSMLDGLQA
jgi:hypothetical protein